tara:strand:- start:241 stop:648 length:408 start_codon:yes stop_codon:yes gene_type:complete
MRINLYGSIPNQEKKLLTVPQGMLKDAEGMARSYFREHFQLYEYEPRIDNRFTYGNRKSHKTMLVLPVDVYNGLKAAGQRKLLSRYDVYLLPPDDAEGLEARLVLPATPPKDDPKPGRGYGGGPGPGQRQMVMAR